jgi:hypothetical protein
VTIHSSTEGNSLRTQEIHRACYGRFVRHRQSDGRINSRPSFPWVDGGNLINWGFPIACGAVIQQSLRSMKRAISTANQCQATTYCDIDGARLAPNRGGASLSDQPHSRLFWRGYFASAIHFRVASQRSWPRCIRVSSLLRRPAASVPTPASSITTWHMAPLGSRYQE